MRRESERDAGEAETDEGLGEFSIEDSFKWSLMQVQPGVVALTSVLVDGVPVEAPLFITKGWVDGDGSITGEFTPLGTGDPQTSRKLTQLSKNLNLVHFCMTPVCSVPGNYLAHVQNVFLVRGNELNAETLGYSGQRRWWQLCMEHLGIDVSTSVEQAPAKEKKAAEPPARGL